LEEIIKTDEIVLLLLISNPLKNFLTNGYLLWLSFSLKAFGNISIEFTRRKGVLKFSMGSLLGIGSQLFYSGHKEDQKGRPNLPLATFNYANLVSNFFKARVGDSQMISLFNINSGNLRNWIMELGRKLSGGCLIPGKESSEWNAITKFQKSEENVEND